MPTASGSRSRRPHSAKALSSLNANVYDRLISDLGMLKMDGYELIDEVRRRPATRHLRVIAMSGFGRRVDAHRALEAGFNVYAPNPADDEDLKAALGRLMNNSSPQKSANTSGVSRQLIRRS